MAKPPKPVHTGSTEVLTLEEVWAHLKIDTDVTGSPPSHPDDAMLTAMIHAAHEAAESYTGRAIVRASYTLALDEFPSGKLDFQTWPVISVESVVYIAPDGTETTLSAAEYILDDYDTPAHLHPVTSWPATKTVPNAVLIAYTAGSTNDLSPDPYPCPLAIKQAMLLMIGHWYENRQAVVGTQRYELPMGVTALLMPHRINLGM